MHTHYCQRKERREKNAALIYRPAIVFYLTRITTCILWGSIITILLFTILFFAFLTWNQILHDHDYKFMQTYIKIKPQNKKESYNRS